MSNRLVINIDNKSTAFLFSDVRQIFAYGMAGNDVIWVNERYGSISMVARLMGGDGRDTLVGGSGNDLLFGEGDNDKIYGGGGRDRIDGGLGTDRLYGQAGKNWFVHYKTVELMDFSRGDALLS